MGETGFPQIGSTSWYGALAPAKTPPALIKKLHDEFVSALQTPDIRESLVAGGAEIVGNSPAQFALFLSRKSKLRASCSRSQAQNATIKGELFDLECRNSSGRRADYAGSDYLPPPNFTHTPSSRSRNM
jgi:hypothetical protein